MGTRSVTYIYEGGKCRLELYTQFDSHFDSLGKDLLGFVSNKKNLEKLREALPRYDRYMDNDDMLFGSACKVLGEIIRTEGPYIVDPLKGDRYDDLAYVIDLDRMTFEAYKGLNKEPLREDERFYDASEPDEDGYYPFRECGVFDLNDLPSADEFVRICEENAYGPS